MRYFGNRDEIRALRFRALAFRQSESRLAPDCLKTIHLKHSLNLYYNTDIQVQILVKLIISAVLSFPRKILQHC